MTAGVYLDSYLALLAEQGSEVRQHVKRKDAALIRLGRIDIESHLAAGEVNAIPRERQHFGDDAPAGEIGEAHHRFQVDRPLG